MELVNFLAAVERLGSTNRARGAKLGMTARRVEQWKTGDAPRLLRVLVRHPALLQALLDDAREDAKQTSIAS